MQESKDKSRFIILQAVMWFIFFIFVLKLMNLQIVNGENYLDMQNKSSYRTQIIKAARGEIVDRNGEAFTKNVVSYDVVFDKALTPEESLNDIILRLCRIMEKQGETWNDSLPLKPDGSLEFTDDEDEIKRLKGKNFLDLNSYADAEEVNYWLVKRYKLEDFSAKERRMIAGVRYEMEKQNYSLSNRYLFSEDIKIETAVLIRQENFTLPGVDVVETAKRSYVDGDLAPHIIGRTGVMFAEEVEYYMSKGRGYTPTDIVGKDGIEKTFEDVLRGTNGERKIELSPSYEVRGISVEKEPVPGNTVVLTLDKNIQRAAMEALRDEIKFLNETAPEGKGKEADAGAVVAIDVKNSELLCAVSYPSYDLSRFSEDFAKNNSDKRSPFLNRAFSGRYAPGSCFKPVTGTAALNEGLATKDTKVTCTGVYTALADKGYAPTCLSSHGPMTVADAIRHSCNIYFYEMGRQLEIPRINEYAMKLGLGVKTGIELSETAGTLNNPKSKNPGDSLQAAIGQLDNGFSPLQLANYCATLARDGVRQDVTLIKGISPTYDLKDMKPDDRKRPKVPGDIDSEVFDVIRDGMVQVTQDPRGTAYRYLNDYPLVVAAKTGTPETKEFPNSTFICYAPADDPQIAVAVVIEKGWHGYTGAPVARKVMDAFFFPEAVKEQEGEESSDDAQNEDSQNQQKTENNGENSAYDAQTAQTIPEN